MIGSRAATPAGWLSARLVAAEGACDDVTLAAGPAGTWRSVAGTADGGAAPTRHIVDAEGRTVYRIKARPSSYRTAVYVAPGEAGRGALLRVRPGLRAYHVDVDIDGARQCSATLSGAGTRARTGDVACNGEPIARVRHDRQHGTTVDLSPTADAALVLAIMVAFDVAMGANVMGPFGSVAPGGI